MFMVTLAAFPAVISGIKSENHGDRSEWTGRVKYERVCTIIPKFIIVNNCVNIVYFLYNFRKIFHSSRLFLNL